MSEQPINKKKRLAILIAVMSLALMHFAYNNRSDPRKAAAGVAIAIFFTITISLPIYWTITAPLKLSGINEAIQALRNNQPCDREELKRACRRFPQNPDLMRLAQLPLSAPVPADLLDRIQRSSPELAAKSTSRVKFVFKIFTAVIILLAIVRFLSHLFK